MLPIPWRETERPRLKRKKGIIAKPITGVLLAFASGGTTAVTSHDSATLAKAQSSMAIPERERERERYHRQRQLELFQVMPLYPCFHRPSLLKVRVNYFPTIENQVFPKLDGIVEFKAAFLVISTEC